MSDLAAAEALIEAGDIAGARAIGEQLLDEGVAGVHNLLGYLAHHEGRLIEAQLQFELACSLAPEDVDARDNLAAVRAELGALYGAAPAAAAAPAAPQADFSGSFDDLRRGVYGPGLSATLLGRYMAAPLGPGLEQRLLELPGATTSDERRFLCRFAACFWDGQGDVFENGPMFGGTTRALALGMLGSANRSPDARLQTFDWFYYGSDTDASGVSFDAMIRQRLISSGQKREMEESRSFKAVFDTLHSGHDYSPLVNSHVAYLPGAPGDVAKTGEPTFSLPEGRRYSLVFIDGCKSWYGTRFTFEQLAPYIEPGSHLIFQDYGWYTCFWLPSFINALGEHFRLVAHVDDTYAFELLAPLDADDVRARFPEHPKDFGIDAFDDLFMRALIDAGERSDVHAMVALTIQHAGAMAYLGMKAEAKQYISGMLTRPEFFPFRRRMIERALVAPTYSPEGAITL
ncbi:tetratricopeptide repeat protein [Solirubrobacter soli]|uniref:tetratricopeptide repeat protein n=1 Tax=Solirubrobacter soli TaxID=363832 RepID=UPI00041FCFB6|nr:hypothetical protein [Solirubrobacter soli]